jgi:glycerate dehydrogenase
LSWKPIEQLGNLQVYDRTNEEQVLERCNESDVVLTNKVPLTEALLAKLPGLKFISILATGINVVDVEAAARFGIRVSNVPAYSTNSVAQQTFALILELINKVGAHDQDIRQGGWKTREHFSYTLDKITELAGKKLGLLGWGQIARKVAEIGKAFGMHIQVTTQYPDATDVEFVDAETLFSSSDIVSIHTSLTKPKEGLVNGNLINKMKKSACLINTSRGQLINDHDLAAALNADQIRGAGIDVFSQEPPPEDHPLLAAKNVVLTPHIAWASLEARERLMQVSAENILRFQEGNPINIVN